jgi:hypothetical protein
MTVCLHKTKKRGWDLRLLLQSEILNQGFNTTGCLEFMALSICDLDTSTLQIQRGSEMLQFEVSGIVLLHSSNF